MRYSAGWVARLNCYVGYAACGHTYIRYGIYTGYYRSIDGRHSPGVVLVFLVGPASNIAGLMLVKQEPGSKVTFI